MVGVSQSGICDRDSIVRKMRCLPWIKEVSHESDSLAPPARYGIDVSETRVNDWAAPHSYRRFQFADRWIVHPFAEICRSSNNAAAKEVQLPFLSGSEESYRFVIPPCEHQQLTFVSVHHWR